MAEGGLGRGRGGRGAMIAKLLEMQQKPGQAPPTSPAPNSSSNILAGTAQQASRHVIGGRGAMLQRIIQEMSASAEQVAAPRPPHFIAAEQAAAPRPPHVIAAEQAAAPQPPHVIAAEQAAVPWPPHVIAAEQAAAPQPPHFIAAEQAAAPRPPHVIAAKQAAVPWPPHVIAAEQAAVPRPPHVVGGRGAILQRIQQTNVSHEIQAKPPQQPFMPIGRGRVLQMLQNLSVEQTPAVETSSTSRVQAHSKPAVDNQPEVETAGGQIEIVPDRPPVVMRGSMGKEIPVTANYIPLYLLPGRGIYEYEVRFHPPEDDRILCEKLLFGQHRDLFGKHRRTFDGVTLYLPHKLADEALNLTSTHPVTNEKNDIVLSFRREKAMTECTHMYNVLFKNIQRELKLTQLDRKYYSQDLAYSIPQHKLEVWPGFVTAVDAFEDGIMLNCDASHKVLRTQTVYDLIKETTINFSRDWKEILQKQLIGQTVMTKRPVRTYRVDDIDFTQNPTNTFQNRDGESISFIEYYRRKDISIKDLKQPLLVHRPTKPNKRPGGVGLILLIPELCFLTGLTDEMRSDFKVMKDVATYTRINPNQRQLALQKFIENIKGSPNCVKLLDEWGLKVPDSTVDLTGRIIASEDISFGMNYVDRGSSQADWGRAATNQHMLEVVHINSWVVIFSQRDDRNANGFIDMMNKVCPQMGMQVKYPVFEKIRDDRTETYLKSLRAVINKNTELVVIIFPSSRDDRYAAVKKLCCVDHPIPSQVINSRTISRPDKLRSIVQKIALQINCKLGGALWAVKIPFKKAMICGIDTYHDSKTRAKSVAAFVASMNSTVTRWHSQVFIQSSEREMVDGISTALLTALNKYYEVNHFHPDTVIVYRDGVGDGQLKVCEEHEVAALKKAFIYVSPDYQPYLAFIICQKRINTRIFTKKGGDQYDNPPPGTVVDYCVTRRYLHDFYLISQMVRQGTVTPTHYIVLHNSTRLDADKLQKLTYKMCHLYYNWPGTVRVPAPCQYAHKLAHLVGCSVHKEPAQVLCDKLFFL